MYTFPMESFFQDTIFPTTMIDISLMAVSWVEKWVYYEPDKDAGCGWYTKHNADGILEGSALLAQSLVTN